MISLKDRIENYKNVSDLKLLSRLPVMIVLNGRSFSKATALLEKPYDLKLAECFHSTILRLCSEIEGAVFAYHYNDEIILVLRNDFSDKTLPWYDNKIQKICSVSASIASIHLNDCISALDLNLTSDPIFTSQVFVVPSLQEAINVLIFKQQNNFYISAQLACVYELLKKYDKYEIKEMLQGLSIDEKIDLLENECEIDFASYPEAFRRGIAVYKAPKIIDETIKNKWFLNEKIPIFTQEQEFLNHILENGNDILRTD